MGNLLLVAVLSSQMLSVNSGEASQPNIEGWVRIIVMVSVVVVVFVGVVVVVVVVVFPRVSETPTSIAD